MGSQFEVYKSASVGPFRVRVVFDNSPEGIELDPPERVRVSAGAVGACLAPSSTDTARDMMIRAIEESPQYRKLRIREHRNRYGDTWKVRTLTRAQHSELCRALENTPGIFDPADIGRDIGRWLDDAILSEFDLAALVEHFTDYEVLAFPLDWGIGAPALKTIDQALASRWYGWGKIGFVLVMHDPARPGEAQEALDAWWGTLKSYYYSGEVFGYEILDNDGECVDSCWGFIGYEADYALEEATRSAQLSYNEIQIRSAIIDPGATD